MISGRFFKEVFVTEIYKPVRKLGHMKTVIDLGATTGEFSLWVYPQADKIYAIEADENVFPHLLQNVQELPKIIPHYFAIAGENGIRRITLRNFGGSSIVNTEAIDIHEVKTMTLASFLDKNKIKQVDCLKIDVEGAEKEIFEAEDFPEVADRIKYIIGEPHKNFEAIKKTLNKNGFKFNPYRYGYIAKRK